MFQVGKQSLKCVRCSTKRSEHDIFEFPFLNFEFTNLAHFIFFWQIHFSQIEINDSPLNIKSQ